MNATRCQELADQLWDAEMAARPISVPEDGDWGVDDAYQIQNLNAQRRRTLGDEPIGYKVAATAQVTRQVLAADEPVFGILHSSMQLPSGATVLCAPLVAPRVEAEIAVLLGEDLAGPGLTATSVRPLVAGYCPAIEVADSRWKDRMTAAHLVADDASAARIVLHPAWLPLGKGSLAELEVVVTVGGRPATTGTAAEVLGDPLASLCWLADKLGAIGHNLKAGQLVMTGSFHAPLRVSAGDRIAAAFTGLPPVEVAFA